MRLRSDILWAARRWRASRRADRDCSMASAGAISRRSTESERADILRAAIGYALGEEPIGLARFREKYAAKMAEGAGPPRLRHRERADRHRRRRNSRTSPRRSLGTNTLDAFLRDLRKRYPDAAAITPAAAGKASAGAAAPAGPRRPRTGKGAGKPPAPSSQAATPEKAAANAPAKRRQARRRLTAAEDAAAQGRCSADRIDLTALGRRRRVRFTPNNARSAHRPSCPLSVEEAMSVAKRSPCAMRRLVARCNWDYEA